MKYLFTKLVITTLFFILLSQTLHANFDNASTKYGFESKVPGGIVVTSALSAFTTCGGTASTAQSFTISGAGLGANITITAPTGFEVSTNASSGFATSIELVQTGGFVPSTTVYARIASAATTAPAANITCTSTIYSQNVAVSGTVNAAPSGSFTVTPAVQCSGVATKFNAPSACASNGAINFSGISTSALRATVTTQIDNITMEIWVKWSGIINPNSNQQVIFYNGNTGNGGYGIVTRGSGNLQILVGGRAFLSSSLYLTPGIWQHVAIVRNSGTWSMYLNGTSASVSPNTTTPNSPTVAAGNQLAIGSKQSGGETFYGEIDEAKFWTVARNSSQISSDMTACSQSATTGLLGYWSFNEGSGTTASDGSGNGYTISVSNTNWLSAGAPTGGTYAWSFGDGTTSTESAIAYTYASAGTKSANLTVTNTNGCSSSSTLSIIINQSPTASITGTSTACSLVSLTAAGGISYAWSGGNSTNTASNTFSSSNNYSVTVTDAIGCTATTSQSVTVNSLPSAAISGPVATLTTFINSGLTNPYGIAKDRYGNLYIANYFGNSISKVSADGTVSSFISSGLNRPSGLAFDASGNLYVANYSGNSISKVSESGTVTSFVSSGLSNPAGLAFDTSGNLYIANYSGNSIIKVSASGTATSFISSGLNRPIALAFDGSGNLYVANYSGNSISKVTVDGALTSFINSGLSSPAGLAFDGSGNLYVSNYSNNSISKISATGIASSYINYDLNRPRGLRYDTLNNVLYVANYNGSSVSKILAPVAYSPVTCNNGTITLMASPQTPSSEAIDWYALATGGSALFTGSNNFTTPIITTTTNYYAVARNTTTGCVSATRTAITATINSCNTWVGGNSIDWGNPVNWSAGTVPGDTSDVTIPSGTTNAPNANTTQTVRNLVIDSGAVVTVTGTLQIAGSITNNGTFNANAGTVVLNGTSAQTIPANAFTSSIVNNLTINNASGVTLGGALKITGVLQPTAGVLNTGGNLTLVSTTVSGGGAIGQGSSAGGYINGTVNVQRFSQAQRGYRTLSHPYTTDQSLSLLTDNIRITGLTAANGLYGVAGGAAQAFNYVPTGLAGNASQVLVPITNATSNSWAVGKAIYLFVRGNGNEGAGGPGSSSYSGTISPVTLDVSSGNVNQGDVIVNLAYGSALTDNYNLIGNPYPCPINLKNVTGITSYGTVYVYNPVKSSGILDAFTFRGGFDSYDNAGNPDIIIPSMGGFYIKATGAGQSLTFHETDKAINSTPTYSVFGTTKIPSFRLNISTSKGNVDDVKIGFNSTSTAAANDTYDAPKLVNGLFDFYSLSSNNKQLAIDYRSESQVTNSIIPLGIKTNVYGTYSISLSAFKDLPTTQLLLRDKLLNKEIPLTKVGDSYTFDITSDTLTKGNNRFEIGLLTATVLPTNLTSFRAQLQTNNNVAVTWVTASEVNVDYYQVQRSTNGNSFSSIGKVDAKGADNYTYNDDLSTVTPQPSTVYYRLQMADKDGSVAYSKVLNVQLAKARKALSIYPNPVQATLFAQVTATKAGKITIVVTDMQGKQLRSQTAALNEGITALSLDLNGLAAGNYVLVVTDSDGEQQKQQFVKQ